MITDYGVKGLIGTGLRAKPDPMSERILRLAKMVPSNVPAGQSERLDFLASVAPLREWIGPRLPHIVAQNFHTATLKKFESTAQVPLDLVNNDKTAQVQEIAGGLNTRYRQWKTKQLINFLALGGGTTLGVAFDGLSFFNDTHVWGAQTMDNALTHAAATGTSPTANEAADAICEAIQALYSFVDDQGEPINEGMTDVIIVVGTTIGNAVFQAVNDQQLDTGSGTRDNPVKGWAKGLNIEVIISPRFTDSDAFVAVNASADACPMVFIENEGDRKVTMKGSGSDFEHDHDAWEYGVKAVGTPAYGRFTDAVQMTFT